jgi:hypothetical protein
MRFILRSAFAGLVAVVAMSAMTATAFASGKPFVETKPATGIWELTATLNGVVNPNGAATKYHFQYGTTTSYGNTTAEVSVGEGTTNLEEAKSGLYLAPETTYHFRIVATNTNGTTDGSDEVFKTAAKSKGLPEISGAKLRRTFTATFSGEHAFRWLPQGGVNEIACKKASATGEVTGAKTLATTDVLNGCRPGGEPFYPGCENTQVESEIVAPFSVTLVYLSKAKKELALLYSVPKELAFHCLTAKEQVFGSFLVPVVANKSSTTYTLVAKASEVGQEPSEYENEAGVKVKALLEVSEEGKARQPLLTHFEESVTFAEAAEFKG